MVEKNKIEISIVILCYKAGKEIIKFIECIYSRGSERKIEFEIILVANYWPNENDITPAIINASISDKPNPFNPSQAPIKATSNASPCPNACLPIANLAIQPSNTNDIYPVIAAIKCPANKAN